MILTETVNVLESMRFLVTARHTLADICRSTRMENRELAAEYFINEASDYEIMHTLVTGELPNEKYNQEAEVMMFGLLKQQLVESLDFIHESFVDKFIAEINSLYPYYSTAKPILEFQLFSEQDPRSSRFTGPGASVGSRSGGAYDPILGMPGTGKDAYPGGKKIGDYIHQLKKKLPSAKEIGSAINKFALSPAGKAVGGAALAALLIYGGTKVYKRFLSQAAKKCAGLSGADKTACMRKAKAEAIQKQIADIKSGSAVCAKSKNPEACKAGVNKKIAKLQAKVQQMAA
jgi:hypothetical protein